MLDVITIISETTPKGFVEEARRSVRAASELCTVPLNIVETPGVPGHIGQAMRNGLAQCRGDYVAWVDDDDFVLPNAFSCLERHFAVRPSAICAREIRLLANGMLRPQRMRHHLTAFRRDVLDAAPLESFAAFPNVQLQKIVSDSAVDELSWVYVYRLRMSAGLALRASFSEAERRAILL